MVACKSKYHAGLLRTPVEFQRRTLTADAAGGWTEVIDGKARNIRFMDNVDFLDRWLEITCDGGVAT